MTLRVNLLAWREKQLDKRYRFWLTVILAGVAAVVLLLLLLGARAQWQIRQHEIDVGRLSDYRHALKTRLEQVNALKADYQQAATLNRLSEQRFEHSVQYVQLLQHLSTAVPTGVWIKQMSQSAALLNLEGQSQDYNRILTLSKALRLEAVLPKTQLREVKQLADENLYFSLDATLRAVEKP
ncbi:hypothetical protein GA565_02525 [Rouxiella sp. S1S-2]|uniref:PilN domain-containing protein n=1 Tax=Rouxiella sp. S1S-2 TaxID=2653856 RepID=UPI001264D5F8|nr:PilN domain-containing protein [Rouxiella sp. S1S-2]KAB7894950.1 hypothetical protein GA565_02525 [Rouxiella sp. S1S-2]